MSMFSATPGRPLVFKGSAHERGLMQAQAGSGHAGAGNSILHPRELAGQVRAATVARVERARSEGWITPDMLAFVAAQRRFAETHDPDGLAELAGIAEGFAIPEDDLFLHLHLGTLRDLAEGATIDSDGCSAWATSAGPDGPLVVKNRDFTGTHLGVQRLIWHEGLDISTGGMMCLGSLGSPGAYSSGMNAAGLALADTQIGAHRHRVGWLRYFLMTRILATCATVREALEFIASVPHAGGGSLIMGDATGATVAAELGACGVAVARGTLSFRTNHFLSPELNAQTLVRGGGRINANSEARLGCLTATLPRRSWDVAAAAALMARHPSDPEGAPICQHPDSDDDSMTISSVIYATQRRCLYFHEGNPCAGRWQVIELPA